MSTFQRSAALAALGMSLLVAGCNTLPAEKHLPDEAAVITGTPSRRNYTPLEPAFSCLAMAMRQGKVPTLNIAVGDVKDYTGKYSQSEGNAITQGGALMIYSALGKMGDVIQLQERFDTRIAELELAYTDKRQLGDGQPHAVEPGKPPVPWVPYFGGSILRSTYYIVGGITELNYNIASSGAELTVSGVGGKRRTFTMNVGVDLRIVDTRTLVVARTVSLQKQIIGEEIGLGVYRFFGNWLMDLNVGAKNQEPLQLGVRTAIEHGVLELISSIAGIDPGTCVDSAGRPVKTREGDVLGAPVAAAAAPARAREVATNGQPTNAVQAVPLMEGRVPENMAGAAQAGAPQQVPFEFGSASISTSAMSVLEKIAGDAAQGRQVAIQLLARDTETFAPSQRRELTNQRIKVVTDFITGKGIAAQRVGVTWAPAPTDQQMTRQGAGFQLVATMVVAP